MKLQVIVGTTRQGRQTIKQAKWVAQYAAGLEDVQVELVDLADYPLAFFEEPVSPRYNPNRQPDSAAQKWLDKLAEADAYVFVSPEYNHSIPGVLKNAFDYVDFQMMRKPAGMATHGTVAGARAAMHLKEVISESQAVPISSFVAIHGMSEAIDEEGNLSEKLRANPYGPQAQLEAMLAELKWYSDALAVARANG